MNEVNTWYTIGSYVIFTMDYLYNESLDLPSIRIANGSIGKVIADGINNVVINFDGTDYVIPKSVICQITKPEDTEEALVREIVKLSFEDPINGGNQAIYLSDLLPLIKEYYR